MSYTFSRCALRRGTFRVLATSPEGLGPVAPKCRWSGRVETRPELTLKQSQGGRASLSAVPRTVKYPHLVPPSPRVHHANKISLIFQPGAQLDLFRSGNTNVIDKFSTARDRFCRSVACDISRRAGFDFGPDRDRTRNRGLLPSSPWAQKLLSFFASARSNPLAHGSWPNLVEGRATRLR